MRLWHGFFIAQIEPLAKERRNGGPHVKRLSIKAAVQAASKKDAVRPDIDVKLSSVVRSSLREQKAAGLRQSKHLRRSSASGEQAPYATEKSGSGQQIQYNTFFLIFQELFITSMRQHMMGCPIWAIAKVCILILTAWGLQKREPQALLSLRGILFFEEAHDSFLPACRSCPVELMRRRTAVIVPLLTQFKNRFAQGQWRFGPYEAPKDSRLRKEEAKTGIFTDRNIRGTTR